jgi:hypothetical protein
LEDATFLMFHWAHEFSSKISLKGQIVLDSHWFMKDEKVIDWREKISQLPLDKENKFKEGS